MRTLDAVACCCVLCLGACGEPPPDARGPDGKATPALVAVAERGDLPALDALLSVGEAPDVLDSCRWTPLMKAAQKRT